MSLHSCRALCGAVLCASCLASAFVAIGWVSGAVPEPDEVTLPGRGGTDTFEYAADLGWFILLIGLIFGFWFAHATVVLLRRGVRAARRTSVGRSGAGQQERYGNRSRPEAEGQPTPSTMTDRPVSPFSGGPWGILQRAELVSSLVVGVFLGMLAVWAVVMKMASSHFSVFLRPNYEQALAVPFCVVFGLIAASQGHWWSVFIFGFSAVYAWILFRAWRKSQKEAKPSRSALVNRRDVQRLLHDPELLSKARELPTGQGVHAGVVRHGADDVSFVKLDARRLTVTVDPGPGIGSGTPASRSFSTLAEAMSWCRTLEVAWLSGTRAEDRVLHQLFRQATQRRPVDEC